MALADRIGRAGYASQPASQRASLATPWGSYVRGDLSIVSTSNLPVEAQIDVANFSVALFASQITRLSYAETSLSVLLSGLAPALSRTELRAPARNVLFPLCHTLRTICRRHAPGKSSRNLSDDNRLTSVPSAIIVSAAGRATRASSLGERVSRNAHSFYRCRLPRDAPEAGSRSSAASPSPCSFLSNFLFAFSAAARSRFSITNTSADAPRRVAIARA